MNGRIFELGAGFVSEVRYERSKGKLGHGNLSPRQMNIELTSLGAVWKVDDSFTPSAVAAKWDEVASFKDAEHPINSEDNDMQVIYLLYDSDIPNQKADYPRVC